MFEPKGMDMLFLDASFDIASAIASEKSARAESDVMIFGPRRSPMMYEI